jgi:hypothetical protein
MSAEPFNELAAFVKKRPSRDSTSPSYLFPLRARLTSELKDEIAVTRMMYPRAAGVNFKWFHCHFKSYCYQLMIQRYHLCSKATPRQMH